MRPLTLDDLLPLDEFADQRREFFAAHRRYLDRYRRVRIGPRMTLLFENRQTLWFRVQDVLRVARLADAADVQAELDVYNRLLPGHDCLQAALLLDIPANVPLANALAPWRDLKGDDLRLRLGDGAYPGLLLTSRPEDRCVGAAHWVRFAIDAVARTRLADPGEAAFFEVHTAEYRHDSPPLGDDIRQSLLDDLRMPERDAA